MKILLICESFPYPPRRDGVALRYNPVIEFLSSKAEIDLVVITDDLIDSEAHKWAKKYLNRYSIIPRGKSSKVSLFQKIATRLSVCFPGEAPLEFKHYRKKYHLREIERFSKDVHYQSVLLAGSIFSDYIKRLKKMVSARKWILDSIDSVSLHLVRRKKSSLLYSAHFHRLKSWESKWRKWVDVLIYISPKDKAAVLGNDNAANVTVIPNGVYYKDYLPDQNAKEAGTFHIGFLGNMSYSPNISAVDILYNDIFLSLSQKYDHLRLSIIGRSPGPEIAKLGNNPKVEVTGTIDNIWPYINAVDVFVFPMTEGAGQQNKVLDVMFSEKPVMTNEICNAGVGAQEKRDIVLMKDDDKADHWKSTLEDIMKNPDQLKIMGKNAKKFVLEKYSWDSINNQFLKVLLE